MNGMAPVRAPDAAAWQPHPHPHPGDWQSQQDSQVFSRWSSDQQDDWEAYRVSFDAAASRGAPSVEDVTGQDSGDAAPQPAISQGVDMVPDEYRHHHDVQVIDAFGGTTGARTFPPLRRFEDTFLPPQVIAEILNAGFAGPTPVQAQSWPILSAGHDMIGIAKSGSGKTLAFLGPAFSRVLESRMDPSSGCGVLVLAPTRELARQIQLEALRFGRSSGILACAVAGGGPRGEQLEFLTSGCHILIATPGRLNEFREHGYVQLQQVQYLVMDEADRMLDLGFEPQIRTIVEDCPQGSARQTLLFSATWPQAVQQLAFDFLTRPIHVHIGEIDAAKANTDIRQEAIILERQEFKDDVLQDILARHFAQGDLCIVFVGTKRGCQDLSWKLQRKGFCVAEIHGDKDQKARELALRSFTCGYSRVLLATDIASRGGGTKRSSLEGLDVKGVRLVVNYDAASTAEDYVHRIGRTGRAGEKGMAYTLLVRDDIHDIRRARFVVEVMENAGQPVPEDLRQFARTYVPKSGAQKSRGADKVNGSQAQEVLQEPEPSQFAVTDITGGLPGAIQLQ